MPTVLLTVISLIVFICTITYGLINDDDDDEEEEEDYATHHAFRYTALWNNFVSVFETWWLITVWTILYIILYIIVLRCCSCNFVYISDDV